jgi:hypothetical protein
MDEGIRLQHSEGGRRKLISFFYDFSFFEVPVLFDAGHLCSRNQETQNKKSP